MRRMRATVCSLICVVFVPGSASASTGGPRRDSGDNGDWPMFRGPRGSGIGQGASPPLRWDCSTGENVRWRLELPGLGLSSPVIHSGRVFITTAIDRKRQPVNEPVIDAPTLMRDIDMRSTEDSAVKDWLVLCVDIKSGEIQWSTTVHSGTPRPLRHAQNSFATPTPVIQRGRVVAMFGAEGMYCLDLEGRVIWQRDFGELAVGSYENRAFQWGYASSPTAFEGLVFVQGDVDTKPFLMALDLESGREVWRVERSDLPSWSTPVVQTGWGEPQLIVNAPFYVAAYAAATGHLIWKLYWGMEITEPTAVCSLDFVFVACGKGRTSPIFAITRDAMGDITPRQGAAESTGVRWRSTKGGPNTTTPICYDGYLYALSDFGILRCFRADSGVVAYEHRIVGQAFQASPVAIDGKLYFTSVTGRVFVVAAGPEFNLLAESGLGETCQATPAISDGKIIFRTRKALYCIENGVEREPVSGRN